MTDLPTIDYNSSVEDVQRVLDAGGVIWVVDPRYTIVEWLYQCEDGYVYEYIDHNTAGADNSHSLREQWSWLKVANAPEQSPDARWSVEYPTNA